RLLAARRLLVVIGRRRLLVRWRGQSGSDACHPRAESQLGVSKALAKSAVCPVHQLAHWRAGGGDVSLLPPLAPRASGPRGNGYRPSDCARGAAAERELSCSAQAGVGDGAGVCVRLASAVRASQTSLGCGARQSVAAARFQRPHPAFLGGQGARLSADRFAVGDGTAPGCGALHLRALRVPAGAGDVLVLRAIESIDVQRRLPQRASRLPVYPRFPLGRAARTGARVLRLAVQPQLLDQDTVAVHQPRESRRLQPRQATLSQRLRDLNPTDQAVLSGGLASLARWECRRLAARGRAGRAFRGLQSTGQDLLQVAVQGKVVVLALGLLEARLHPGA